MPQVPCYVCKVYLTLASLSCWWQGLEGLLHAQHFQHTTDLGQEPVEQQATCSRLLSSLPACIITTWMHQATISSSRCSQVCFEGCDRQQKPSARIQGSKVGQVAILWHFMPRQGLKHNRPPLSLAYPEQVFNCSSSLARSNTHLQ